MHVLRSGLSLVGLLGLLTVACSSDDSGGDTDSENATGSDDSSTSNASGGSGGTSNSTSDDEDTTSSSSTDDSGGATGTSSSSDDSSATTDDSTTDDSTTDDSTTDDSTTDGGTTDAGTTGNATMGGTSGGGAPSTSGTIGTLTTGGVADENFSFFVTSFDAMVELSQNQYGFGGDLGGLAGADAICQTIGASVGAGDKTWRAFLSATDDGTGSPVNAIDRIGSGPWYDANGRMIAADLSELTDGNRPAGDAAAEDLPDEYGRSLEDLGQGHDILTGSDSDGMLYDDDPSHTCNDWTSSEVDTVGEDYTLSFPIAGHAWPSPANSGWIQSHGVWGCAPGYQFSDSATMAASSEASRRCVGCAGGYGGIYCFALNE